jgi:hypothetical protein
MIMTFKQFLQLEAGAGSEQGLFANVPGNPAFGGKKPSDGRGKNPMLSNQPGAAGGGGGMGMGGGQPMMMKKKMKKK